MQCIGIIGAMASEVKYLKEQMSITHITEKAGMQFYRGILNGRDVVIVQSGVGKVHAAVCAQILIDLFSVDFIINTGIAGGLDNAIDIGDMVISTDALQHDMDTGEFGYAPGQIPGVDVLSFQADESMVDLAVQACEKVNPDIKVFKGRIVTGDQFVNNSEKKQWLVDTFAGLCVEMEGAAIAQVAYLNQIPFLVIRAISDKADDSAHMDFPEFEAQAIVHSSRLTEELLSIL